MDSIQKCVTNIKDWTYARATECKEYLADPDNRKVLSLKVAQVALAGLLGAVICGLCVIFPIAPITASFLMLSSFCLFMLTSNDIDRLIMNIDNNKIIRLVAHNI